MLFAALLSQVQPAPLATTGVDLVLTAHDHTYVRHCALRKGKCVAAGEAAPIYIVDGCENPRNTTFSSVQNSVVRNSCGMFG